MGLAAPGSGATLVAAELGPPVCRFFLGRVFLSLRDHFCRIVGHLVDMRASSSPVRKGNDPERVPAKDFLGQRARFCRVDGH